MNNKPVSNTPVSNKKWLKWAVPVFLLAFIALAVLSLPSGFSEDLAVIGQGKSVVVLVHDHNYVNSTTLMESLDEARGEFADSIEFRVADVLKPDGKRFADNHGADPITLLFFDPDGAKRLTLTGVHSPASLSRALADTLAEL